MKLAGEWVGEVGRGKRMKRGSNYPDARSFFCLSIPYMFCSLLVSTRRAVESSYRNMMCIDPCVSVRIVNRG